MKTFTKMICFVAFAAITAVAQAGTGSASANNDASSVTGGNASASNSNSGSVLRNGNGNGAQSLTDPVISGPTQSVCPNQSQTYSSSVVAGATVYTWVVPDYATIVTGQGTRTISVSFGSAFVQGYLRVTASNSSQHSNQTVVTLYGKATTPLPISGPETGACPSGTYTYSIAAVPSATSYTWYAPAGCVITAPTSSGNPVTTVSTSVTVTFSSTFHDGVVSVKSNCACGSSTQREKNIRSTLPETNPITGINYGLCNTDYIPYSVSPVANATSYTWSLVPPTGTTIHNNGSSNVIIDFDGAFVKADLVVTADNGCGHGDTRTLKIYSHPANTVTPVGPAGACNNILGASIAYYSVSPVYNASYYTWTVPQGAHIVAGAGTTNVTVDFFGASSGNVSCRADNYCGHSAALPKAVTVNACRVGNNEESVMQTSVYPNPAKDKLTVSFSASENETYSIQMIDMTGRMVINQSNVSSQGINNQVLNLQNISSGLYNLVVTKGETTERLRVVVE